MLAVLAFAFMLNLGAVVLLFIIVISNFTQENGNFILVIGVPVLMALVTTFTLIVKGMVKLILGVDIDE